MLPPLAEMAVARSQSKPGRSSATISIRVAVPLASESNTTRAAMPALRLGSGAHGPFYEVSLPRTRPATRGLPAECLQHERAQAIERHRVVTDCPDAEESRAMDG